jgi:hypothetical protein
MYFVLPYGSVTAPTDVRELWQDSTLSRPTSLSWGPYLTGPARAASQSKEVNYVNELYGAYGAGHSSRAV